MALMVYGIKNCDSMKKAFLWLDTEGITYTFVDFKKQVPNEIQIINWLRGIGDSLVNTKGRSYRQLPSEVKELFNGARRIKAIVAEPTLIKRPLLVNGTAMTVGFHPERWIQVPNLLT